MPARPTHEPPRRICLQPALVLAPVPNPVLGSQHPSPPLAVENRKVADRNPKRTRLQIACAALVGEEFVFVLCVGKWIDSHRADYAVTERFRGRSPEPSGVESR